MKFKKAVFLGIGEPSEERLKSCDITFIAEYDEEMPKEAFQRLSKYKDAIIYTSNAYSTNEAMDRRQKILVSNFESYLAGKPSNKAN